MVLRALIVAAAAGVSGIALAQSTAFTFQGELKDNNAPANGTYDLRFKMYSVATGGTQIGVDGCADNVVVANGRFATTVSTGVNFAASQPYFLEVLVRRDLGLNCTNTTGYTTLPRQAITQTPRASAANVANALASPDGSPLNAVVVNNDGNVGIGTPTPGVPLHIVSTSLVPAVHVASPFAVINLQDTGPNATQTGYVSYRNQIGTETAWVGFGSAGDPNFSIVNARSGGDIVLNPFSGNVGIGTSAPVAKLDVSGNAVFSGLVGIGTTTPSSKLSVRGNVQLGANAELFAPGGPENLRMIRGSINSSGAIDAGLGFSCARVGTGLYRITFDTPFASTPSVTLSAVQPFNQNPRSATFVQSTSNANLVDVFVMFGNSSAGNSDFHFIAVGPR